MNFDDSSDLEYTTEQSGVHCYNIARKYCGLSVDTWVDFPVNLVLS